MKITYILIFFFMAIPLAYADGEIETREELCQVLKPHKQTNAEYVPGVDVHGKAVAPADINAGMGQLNPVIIPVEINLAERFGLDLPLGAELKPTVANLKIHQDGRIEYNDRDITQKLQAQCKDNLPEAIPEALKTDGQKASNAVVSSDKIDGQYPEYNE